MPISGADTPRTVGGVKLLAYDDFSRYPNGALAGKIPMVGPAWTTTGAQPIEIASGRATSNGSGSTGYAFLDLPEPATYLECTAIFSGTDRDAKTMAMVWGTTNLAELLHLIWGPNGFAITLRNAGGAFEWFMDGAWRGPIAQDDATPYRFALYVNGPRVTVIGPFGDTFTGEDERIPALAALTTVFWEPVGTATARCYLTSIRALARHPEIPSLSLLPSPLDLGVHSPAGVIAAEAFQTFWQVITGRTPGGGLPGIEFAPDTIRTYLTEAVAIGAGTIVTRDPLMPGSTIIGSGAGAETVTVTGNSSPLAPSGSRDYTATLTGVTTKVHAVPEPVVGAGITSHPRIDYNSYAGYLQASPHLEVSGFLKYGSIVYDGAFAQILAGRKTGWTTAPGGTLDRTTFDSSTVTLEELAKRLAALIVDLRNHGLIGP